MENIDFTIHVYEVHDGEKLYIEEFSGMAEVIYNHPFYAQDLEFEVTGYQVSGQKKVNGKFVAGETFIPAPDWLRELFYGYISDINDQVMDHLISKLELPQRSYPMQAGRAM